MFKDFSELAGELLQLPINGKTYTIPAVSAADGLKAEDLIRRSAQGEPVPMKELMPLLMGPVYQELLDDNVSLAAFTRAQLTVIADFQQGRDVAEATWETAGNPKELQKFLARLPKRPAEATTTQKPASTNGTRKKNSPKKRTQES